MLYTESLLKAASESQQRDKTAMQEFLHKLMLNVA